MDIKALENKKENLERKIQNATLYINEIESHKKSIFDFWKYTNKDEVSLLTEAEKQERENQNRLKKQFNYEEDLEGLGIKVDSRQKEVFSKNECDAVFGIINDIETFNILNKSKILKRDDTQIVKKLKKFKQEYVENIEEIKEKDFDIFGNIAQDKTKINGEVTTEVISKQIINAISEAWGINGNKVETNARKILIEQFI